MRILLLLLLLLLICYYPFGYVEEKWQSCGAQSVENYKMVPFLPKEFENYKIVPFLAKVFENYKIVPFLGFFTRIIMQRPISLQTIYLKQFERYIIY